MPSPSQAAAVALTPCHLTEQQLVERLLDVAWGRGFTFNQGRLLARHGRAWDAPAGATIGVEGESAGTMLVLLSGRVLVTKRDADGESKPVVELGAGQSIGEMELVDGEPRSASLTAATPVTLWGIDRAGMDALVRENPRLALDMAFLIARTLSRRLRMTTGRLVDMLPIDDETAR